MVVGQLQAQLHLLYYLYSEVDILMWEWVYVDI